MKNKPIIDLMVQIYGNANDLQLVEQLISKLKNADFNTYDTILTFYFTRIHNGEYFEINSFN